MKLIIFDFDGTIADTFELVFEIANRNATHFGFHPISNLELERLRNKSAREILKEFGIPSYKFPMIARRVIQELHTSILNTKPFNGIKDELQKLKDAGFRLMVVSSNSVGNIQEFLDKYDLNFFEEVHSVSMIFGKGRTIKKILHKHSVETKDAMYVGDELRDIEAAHKAGINIVSVSWGYNSHLALAEKNKNTIDSVDKLYEKIKALSNHEQV